MGPFGKATDKSKGVKKGAGQSGKESSNLGRTLQKEPAHVIHTQRLQEKAKKKSEDNGTSASRCKSGDSAAKVEHAGGKGEPKKADRRVIESICCEAKLPDQELLEKREYEIQEHWSSADGLKKGIPVGQVEHFGVWGSKAKDETGKEGTFIICLEQGSDQAVPAQRSWKGGERKLEEKLSTNKRGVPVAQIRTLEMKDSKAESYVAGDKSCLDASSLALPVGLNRIKTRSGPLCEDGSMGKVDVGVSHSQHAQVRHAAGSVDKLDRVFRTHPTALSALAASPSQEMDNMSRSKFYLFNENVQQEGENRSREGIIANSGGRTVESKNMKLQRSSLSPTILASQSQGSRRGSPLRGTSEGMATPVFNNPASSTPSHLVDGARAKSKELHRGSQKTDLILEKKVPCRLASYLDNDCNKTHDTEGASKQLDVIKETESAKFQEVPRVTEGIKKKKWPKDIKSFSHELGPRGGRPYGYARPHSDNDLEELLGALRARFNTAKEEVDGELKVFAADLVEILDKNADSFPEWKEKVEDLLVLAQRCAMMSPSDFRRECEGFVQEIDDKRQELPMGLLKRLHTRMLFILTRCTRLLQFQKETSSVEEGPIHKIQQCLKGVPSIERSWTSTVSKKGKFTFNSRKILPDFSDRPGKAEASVTTGKASIHDEKHMVLSEKSEILHQSQDLSTDYQIGALVANQSTSSLKPRSLREESSGTGGDSQDWGFRELKFRPGDNSTTKIVQESCDYVQSGKKIDADESQDIVAQTTTPSKHSQRMSWGYWTDSENLIEEPDSVICRICEEEVPTSHLEGHSFFCAMADTYDVQGLSLEERLRILADNLEKIAELNTPKSSQPAAGESPDVVKPVKLTFHDGPDNTSPKLSDFHGKGAESRFDDLYAIDTASMEELRGLSSISFKPHLGPRSEQGVASSSAGSMTPRSALTTPRTSQLDLLWAERSNFTEAEDVSQIMELVDIARCVANKSPMEEGAQEYLIACMQDLQDVLGRNKIEALAVDTFGRRIENLLREKYILVCEIVDQRKPDLVSKRLEDDIISVDDGFQSLKSTPTHPAYKDRTTIEDFEILKPISRGAFGRVFLARKRTTGDLFAIKVLRKIDMIRKNAVENILAERDILITVCNPFVVRFFYSFTCRDNLYLVMEYLNGGDLYSLLRNMVCLEEHVARVYIAELVLALEYLHSLGVVHRDLKPDNILIAHDGHIKLTDFGLSKVGLINSTDDLSGPAASGTMLMDENIYQATAGHVQQMERRKERSAVGTPDYLAPEILLGTEHGYTADWWSTGIILFECLTGMPTFNAEHPQIIFDNILNRKIPWPSIPEDMSEEAQDLIDKLLIEDPSQRLGSKGAGEVKAHPFFKHINWDTLAQQKAAFVPNPESLDDTSYFTSRHLESHAHSHHDFIDSTDCSSSSASINSLKARLEEGEDDCGDLAEFESSPSVKNTFSNFSFKNLSQLASINYDLLSQTGKDSSKGHSRQSSVS